MIAPDASEVSELHRERLEAVTAALLAHGVRTVGDLGCGSGALLERLVVEPQFSALVGVEQSLPALERLRSRLAPSLDEGRLRLAHGSFTAPDPCWVGLDALVMMETIEHVDPDRLSQVERALFLFARPRLVLITTPNVEANAMLGVPAGRFRHPDHRFEWSRSRFAAWAAGVAQRQGFAVTLGEIGWSHPRFGAPTQTAYFTREVKVRPG